MRRWAFVWVALAGMVCIGVGASKGQAMPVLRKAVSICLECIGLG